MSGCTPGKCSLCGCRHRHDGSSTRLTLHSIHSSGNPGADQAEQGFSKGCNSLLLCYKLPPEWLKTMPVCCLMKTIARILGTASLASLQGLTRDKQVTAGLLFQLEARLGKNPLPRSLSCWQCPFPCDCHVDQRGWLGGGVKERENLGRPWNLCPQGKPSGFQRTSK